MTKYALSIVLVAAMVTACGLTPPPPLFDLTPPPPRVIAPPAKPSIYVKDGATTEEFQRTRARCLAQAETSQAASADPNAFARAGTWIAVYRYCMRADGWVLTRQ